MEQEREERGVLVKIEFPLPECQEEFEAATHAMDLKGVLWDFAEWLRRKLKYEDPNPDEDVLEVVQEQFYKCLDDRNIKLYD